MVRIRKGESTMKQQAYARKIFNGDAVNKKQAALDVGYSANSSHSIVSHIEKTPGFHNAMAKLAYESNNLAIAAMEEFKARGFKDFSNTEMIKALQAISGAWAKFSAPLNESSKPDKPNSNKLRTVILQQIENQTVIEGSKPIITQEEKKNDESK